MEKIKNKGPKIKVNEDFSRLTTRQTHRHKRVLSRNLSIIDESYEVSEEEGDGEKKTNTTSTNVFSKKIV